ncbi:hypothetical protein DGN07_00615 [Xanthomonas citri pv. fuscans]|nr:hypothetical protein DGN07_00615 [Xanthomonas citri pv. fuscans]
MKLRGELSSSFCSPILISCLANHSQRIIAKASFLLCDLGRKRRPTTCANAQRLGFLLGIVLLETRPKLRSPR